MEETAINKSDIATDAAIKVPLEIAGNLKVLVKQLEVVIETGIKQQKTLSDTKSIKVISDETKKLSAENKTLADIQARVNKSVVDTFKQYREGTKTIKDNTEATKQTNTESVKYVDNLAKMKQELKAAKSEMLGLAATLGEDSEEYKKASIKAGELADAIADVNDNVKASSGDTSIENMSSRFGMLGTKLKNLDFKGANTQIRAIAQLSKEMTFKEAIKGIGGFTQGVVTLGKAILTNPLFILAAIIIGVVVAFTKLKDFIPGLNGVLKLLGDAFGYAIQKIKDFLDWIGVTNFAVSDMAERVVEASKKQLAAIEKRYTREIALAQAAGKQVFDLERQKQEAIIASTSAAIKALNDKTAAQLELSEDEKKDLQDFIDRNLDAQNELKIIYLNQQKFLKDKREKDLEDEKKFLQEWVKMAEDAAKDRVDKFKSAAADRVALIQKEAIAALNRTDLTEAERAKKIKFYDELIAETKKSYAQSAIEEEIAAAEESLKIIGLSAEEEIKVKQKLHDLKLELLNDSFEALQRNQRTELEQVQEGLNEAQEFYGAYANAIGAIFQGITADRLANIDREQKALEAKSANEIKLAGDNATKVKEIQNDLAKRTADLERKRITEQRRAAIFDKAANLIQAGINTALAVTNQLAKGDPYTAFARAIAAGIAGGIQVLAIASKQIPQYELGTGPNGTTSDLVIAGEAGSEAFRTPSGRWGLTPNQATLMRLPVGTDIYAHNHPISSLALAGTTITDRRATSESDMMAVVAANQKSLEHVIKNKRETHFNIGSSRVEKIFKQGESRRFYLDNFYN